jgi:hypothetical protein
VSPRTRLLSSSALLLLLAACSGNAPATPVGSSGGGNIGAYAFPQQDTPYRQVLAQAGRRQRPALLFFWTSW